MQPTPCPACHQLTCPGCAEVNGVAHTPPIPPEVAGWVIERPSPDVLAWAAQTFDMAELETALREVEQGRGGGQIHDLIAEIERKLNGST